MAQQNNSIISFPFKGIIWKLSLDASEKVLVLELRNEEDRSVHFAGVDLMKKSLAWESSNAGASWWMGLEEAVGGKVYLHNYKDPQNPEHEGVFAFNVRDGKEVWRDEKKTFLAQSEGFVIASEGEEQDKKYFKLDSKTGKTIGELDTKSLFKARSAKSRNQSEDLLNSFHFSSENVHFSKIAGFVKQIMEAEPVQALDYLEYGEQVVISFYLYTPEGLMNYLLVMDEEGEVKYKECIGKNLKGIALDTFFIFGDLLIFVKDKKELIIFKMNN